MQKLFENIKVVASGLVYLCGADGCIPCPPDTDTAAMVFVEAGGYVVGFTSLTDEERAAVELLLVGQYLVFEQPIQAPDFVVASPKTKDKPTDALAEAVSESKKEHGTIKSIALIALSVPKYLEELEARVIDLETRLKKLEKK